ncbi:hypothetical protein U0070_007006 [Myodes glareolus]|uniref:Large ribosomal subunit protein uL10 n=1 Tax=Myodes glareolus TaxID=447135 RepID=A0AAW0IBX7_MYOGA
MSKNTMIHKAIQGPIKNNPVLKKLLPHIWENVGFEDLTEIRDMQLANKALGITTKITTEILSDVQLKNTGDKVGASEVIFLNKLNRPLPFPLG